MYFLSKLCPPDYCCLLSASWSLCLMDQGRQLLKKTLLQVKPNEWTLRYPETQNCKVHINGQCIVPIEQGRNQINLQPLLLVLDLWPQPIKLLSWEKCKWFMRSDKSIAGKRFRADISACRVCMQRGSPPRYAPRCMQMSHSWPFHSMQGRQPAQGAIRYYLPRQRTQKTTDLNRINWLVSPSAQAIMTKYQTCCSRYTGPVYKNQVHCPTKLMCVLHLLWMRHRFPHRGKYHFLK